MALRAGSRASLANDAERPLAAARGGAEPRGADGGASAAIGVAGVDLGDELAPDSSLASRLRHAAEAISRMLR